MRKMLVMAPLALSACAAAPPPAEYPVRGASAFVCRGEALGQFTGRPATQELGAEMLRVSGARIIRWVAHGMMITMDFSAERLTVHLTPDNRVERASCG
jgi:hypothetical protein